MGSIFSVAVERSEDSHGLARRRRRQKLSARERVEGVASVRLGAVEAARDGLAVADGSANAAGLAIGLRELVRRRNRIGARFDLAGASAAQEHESYAKGSPHAPIGINWCAERACG